MAFFIFFLKLTEVVAGLAIPAYATLSLINSGKGTPTEYKKWGSYWIVLAIIKKIIFGLLEFLPSVLAPPLLFIRVCIILYLWLPFTEGSLLIWNKFFGNQEVMKKVKAIYLELLNKYAPSLSI